MKNLSRTLAFLISAYALVLAVTPVVHAESPSEDPYQALKEAFDHAQYAKIEDFPLIADLTGANPPFHCIAICQQTGIPQSATGGCSSLQMHSSFIGRVIFTVPELPGQGPLFPETPAHDLVKLTIGFPNTSKTMSFTTNEKWVEYFRKMEPEMTFDTYYLPSKELQTSISLSAYPKDSWITRYRKEGSNLFFNTHITGPRNFGRFHVVDYGYCY